MDHDKLGRLVAMLAGTSVTEIGYMDGDLKMKLTLKRGTRVSAAEPRDDVSVTKAPFREAVTSVTTRTATVVHHVITAGLTGTFYRASAPDQPPFVSLGDVVEEGQTLAVVEAMKMLNTIDADRSGRVTGIFAEDGESVSPDSTLFAIEPLEASDV
jgi:acetyl-CoA carboxylase biotin carboxyl carrier protein